MSGHAKSDKTRARAHTHTPRFTHYVKIVSRFFSIAASVTWSIHGKYSTNQYQVYQQVTISSC